MRTGCLNQLSKNERQCAMKSWLKSHGLLVANVGLFVAFFIGMTFTGYSVYNSDQVEHGGTAVALSTYLMSGDFGEATFENWESEWLQMGMYVVLTAYLFTRGSSESKPLGKPSPQDEDPESARDKPGVPWAARRGGWVLALYKRSLSILFFGLFAATFTLHAITGAAAYSAVEIEHGGSPVNAIEYLGTSQFWFEAFQNWQSEFLAIAVMVGASVYLRHKGSAESKPVAAPHHQTGS